MIKFVLILIFAASAPGEEPPRRIFTEAYESRAACMLSGEVEMSHESDAVDIICEPLEVPEL